jgi:hypothetical protein
MSTAAASGGTKFRLYCQPSFLPGFEKPVEYTLDLPAGSVKEGPMDDRIKIVNAVGKKLYDDDTLPPYRGDVGAAAKPDGAGHFHTLDPKTPEFEAAHCFAAMRMVLDVWERYSGEPVRWFFRDDYRQLEVIPYVKWPNGQAGYGFIELGYGKGDNDEEYPFALNFDVLAHEMGHIILASEIGIPFDADPTQYAGFQEAASDIISLISVLHFEHFRKHLLEKTHGNLHVGNELNKLAELSPTEQIRTACHSVKMSDIDYAWTPAKYLTQKQIHSLGQPFTAAVFDILVEVFHETLVDKKLITRTLDNLAEPDQMEKDVLNQIEDEFKTAYAAAPDGFMDALELARDIVGERLVKSWRRLNVDELTLWNAAASLLTVDRRLSGGKYQNIIRDCLTWREFEP